MKSNYKRLGDYIRQVDVRNRDLSVTTLLGLSVNKQFIFSIANTIGTDMSNYKIVYRNQFVYIPDTSRRGDKIAIALLDKWNNAIVSAIYTVFKVINTENLLPEYLMMWFRRPDFDRYARFKSHGSAREVFKEIFDHAENFKRNTKSRPYPTFNDDSTSMAAEIIKIQ